VLLDDGTFSPKHVGVVSLLFTCIRCCALCWFNKWVYFTFYTFTCTLATACTFGWLWRLSYHKYFVSPNNDQGYKN